MKLPIAIIQEEEKNPDDQKNVKKEQIRETPMLTREEIKEKAYEV